MNTRKLQQGDVILKPVSYHAEITNEQISKAKNLETKVLAEGEATGHKHQMVTGVVQLMMLPEGRTLLKVLSESAKLKHNTHAPIDVPKGDYVVTIKKEYDEVKERQVLD